MSSTLDDVGAPPADTITVVSPEEKVLTGRNMAVLWGDLGVGLLVLVTGALLVPGLGFYAAIAAIGIGSLIGVGLLAAAGAIGTQRGVPTMVMLRPVLGTRGSWLPTLLNVLQLVGWTAVELWAISLVADLVASEVFGFSARGVWLVLAAVLCGGLALWGPVGVTKVWLERFGVWVIGAICMVVTILVLMQDGLGSAISAPGSGGFPTFGIAVDLVIAMPVSWLPLVADYTRFGKHPRAAFVGTFWGYLVANVWLYTLGALLVLGAGATPTPAGIAGGILAVAGGTIAGSLFLVGLLVGETDEAFADIYSGAVSIRNIFPGASQKVLIVGITALASFLAAWLTMERYESFLFLIGSVFVPLFGVLFASYLADRRRAVSPRLRPNVRMAALVPWLCGFVTYHWIVPTGPSWWIDAADAVFGTPLSAEFSWLGGSLPALVVSFLVGSLLLGREEPSRRPRLSSEP